MQITNREIYSLTNYITAVLLLVSPWIVNYSSQSSNLYIPVFTAIIIVACNLCTQWKFSLWKKISIHHRLMIDLAISSFLILCPKLISYDGYVFFIPYLWIGLIKMLLFLCSAQLLDNESMIVSAQIKSAAFKNFMSDTVASKKV